MQKKQGVLIAPPRAASGSFPLCLCVAVPEPGSCSWHKSTGTVRDVPRQRLLQPGASEHAVLWSLLLSVLQPAGSTSRAQLLEFPPQLLEVMKKG